MIIAADSYDIDDLRRAYGNERSVNIEFYFTINTSGFCFKTDFTAVLVVHGELEFITNSIVSLFLWRET